MKLCLTVTDIKKEDHKETQGHSRKEIARRWRYERENFPTEEPIKS